MELVSIIIPIYNIEEFLDRSIGSAAGQTYQNLEILLIDDGSTDASAEICDRWAEKDKRIKVVHQSNSGVSVARNTGLRMATGDYVLQLDSDDYMAPYTVEHLLQTAHEQNADLVICQFVRGVEERYCFEKLEHPEVELVDAAYTLAQIYNGANDALRYTVPWCKLYRRELLEGVSYPEGKIFEDIYITHTIIDRCSRIALLDEVLFYYYRRENSIMNAVFSLPKLDYLQALVDRVRFFADRRMTDLQEKAYDELLHSLVWEYSRTRDLLNSQPGMDYVMKLFRENYRKGYSNKRYPGENKWFLAVFDRNPEWIVLYWKISAKLSEIFKKR